MFKRSHKLDGIEISVIRQMNSLARPDSINLGIGQLPYEPPEKLKEAGAKAFLDGETRYTPNAGNQELRELISKEHERHTRKRVTADNVVVTVGVEQALSIVFGASLDSGDEVLIPEIFFSVYDTIPRINGATPVQYKLNDEFGIDVNDLESKVNSKTKLVVVNTPSNPTGKVLGEEELSMVSEVLSKHPDVYVLSDEVYSNLYFGEFRPDSMARFFDRTIVVDGISKRASATGLRIGWTIAPSEVTKELIKLHQYNVTCATSTSQLASMPVLTGECAKDEERYRSLLRENRDLTLDLLSKIRGVSTTVPRGAFYCFPNISQYGQSRDVAMRILEEGNVLTIPGIVFGEKGDNYLRISYAVNKDKLVNGLKTIIEVLE